MSLALVPQVFESEGAPVGHRLAPDPREELARLEVEEQRPGVVRLSGDRHVKLDLHDQEVVLEPDGGEVEVADLWKVHPDSRVRATASLNYGTKKNGKLTKILFVIVIISIINHSSTRPGN